MVEKHARLSPSKMKYLELCPHYLSDDSPNPAAEEGTLIHDALERDDFFGLTAEQRTLAEMCVTVVNQCLSKGCIAVNEMKLDVLVLDGDPVFGTADKVILHKDNTAHLIDYKMGRTEVDDAEVNIQGQSYALGLFKKFSDLEHVEVIFLIPRQDIVSRHVYVRADIDDIVMRILAINAASHNPEAPFHPTPDGCAWCANKSQCPALRQLAITTASQHAGLPLPAHFEPGTMTSIDDRNKAQLLAPILEDWCKQVKQNNIRAVAEEGLELPNFMLVSRGGARRVIDMGVAFDLLSQQGVSIVQFMLNCSIKIADLTGLIQQTAKDKGEPIGEFVDATMIELERLAAVVQGDPVTYLRKKKVAKQKLIKGT